MSCGASQNLSASGGCPPYNWSLSGGGTLTPSGGGNTSAIYVAPASNPNCANNAMITLTDCCRNIVDIQLAVNCFTVDATALRKSDLEKCCCYELENPGCGGIQYESRYAILNYRWRCDGSVKPTCNFQSNEN